MEFFNNILKKRKLQQCPLPLWKLKLTNTEYIELKNHLKHKAEERHANVNNPFILDCKEACLYFAEFWRREYNGGTHNIKTVYDSLGVCQRKEKYSKELYDAACKGAGVLNIEFYNENNRTDSLNSILYQGGLPMTLLTSANQNTGVWDRFARGLVNRKINFDELDLGVIAKNNESLRQFCEQLIGAIESEQFHNMPFYAENEYDNWYMFLLKLSKEEKKKKRVLHPFSLDWEFRVDAIDKKLYVQYLFTGEQRLPKDFIEEKHLNEQRFNNIHVLVNSQICDTFDYVPFFCRYLVESKHPYHNGDKISVILNSDNTPLISDDLDMTIPHIMYQNKDGKFFLGNRIGQQKSFLIIPQNWKIESASELEQDTYQWENLEFTGIFIPSDFQENILAKSENGTITFGPNSELYWTELDSLPLDFPDIEESLFNADRCRFSLCCDSEEGTRRRYPNSMLYRNKWENEWRDTPSYGEIYAMATDTNGNFVTPTKFINIGGNLSIKLESRNEDSCQIKIHWEHGHVTSNDGTLKTNNVWEFKKENLSDNRIHFTLIPEQNNRNQFSLTLKTPFKEFFLCDMDGNRIGSNCWIPYSDIDKYRYHLIGQDIKYTYGTHKRELKYINDQLYIIENHERIKSIPYEGSLVTLFDSREVINAELERTSQNMINAVVNVCFNINPDNQLNFGIKKSPYRVKQLENGRISIINNTNNWEYKKTLKLLKIDDPSVEPILLPYDNENGYVLPEQIREWGKTLLIGQARGRICPALVDLTKEMTHEDRIQNRNNTKEQISCNLKSSKIGDSLWSRIIGWYNTIQKEDIPASSLLELECVAENEDTLLCLAFQLYALCDENDRETLSEQLRIMSEDLGFSWYWLSPYLNQTMALLGKYFPNNIDLKNDVIKEIFIKWALRQENPASLLSAMSIADTYSSKVSSCIVDIISHFHDWMKELSIATLSEKYGQQEPYIVELATMFINDPNARITIQDKNEIYVDERQDIIDEATVSFFQRYEQKGTIGNEKWLYMRVNAVKAHFRKEINLFKESPEIRRSIIFCRKSCNEQFVIGLVKK